MLRPYSGNLNFSILKKENSPPDHQQVLAVLLLSYDNFSSYI
jgi:hypothetical protein